MPNTRGFEVVTEVTVDVLREILYAAWKSGGDDSADGVIPEYINISPGLSIGPYQIKEGFVQIPQDQLGLNMNTDINGVDVKLGTIIQVEIENPPIESARFFDLTADIIVSTPVRTIDGSVNTGVVFTGLPADAVVVNITSGNPITPISNAAIEEYVHNRYRENGSVFPHVLEDLPVSFPPFFMKIFIEMFDDESDPAKRISVTFPETDKIQLHIPAHLRFYDITGNYAGFELKTPMGVAATITILADYQNLGDHVIAHLSTATVSLENLTPWPGVEGNNYTENKTLASFAGYDLDEKIKTGFVAGAQAQLRAIFNPNPEIPIPTLDQLESFIADQVRAELIRREKILIWQPEAPEGSDVVINDVTPKALSDAMAIGINAGSGANADALVNFIPADRDFATAISAEKVMAEINQSVAESYPDGFPHRLEDVHGHEVDLNSLHISLRTGAIHISGSVTVIDAVLDSIDVDADFSADAGLQWEDSPSGGQIIQPFVIGDPDVDLSLLAWIISFLIGFITFGLVGGIIALVIIKIAENLAERIGGRIIRDDVTNELKGIEAWPQTLDQIGTIEARFINPIWIDPDSVLVAGTMTVTSSFALTAVDFADTHGPYHKFAGQPVLFNGGVAIPVSDVFWDFDDGNTATERNPSHLYGDSGVYIAKLRVKVLQPGGATTKHYARVKIVNTPPKVELGPDITVKEGDVVEFVGYFTDPEWQDTHRARFDFGDNTKPVEAEVTEQHDPPQAQGKARATHAYCDNGIYTVTLTVEDDDGGIGVATMQVTVTNVAPELHVPPVLNVLTGQVVRLKAEFVDPGWCDTHTAEWDFGDCTIRRAIVRETHQSPQGTGIIEASHRYRTCGRYVAKVSVMDDDGAVSEATMLVNATMLRNAAMEAGFRIINHLPNINGKVANEWLPYLRQLPSLKPGSTALAAEATFRSHEMIYRDGRRAQMLTTRGTLQAGIYQRIDANIGWDYEFTAFYHLPKPTGAKACIGIDPNGGSDPAAESVVWVSAGDDDHWRNLSVRATAKRDTITCFLGVRDENGGGSTIYWDRAELFFIQPYCPEKTCQPTCVNFNTLKPDTYFQAPFTHRQLTFTPLGEPLRTTTMGDPPGQLKLAFPNKGVRVDFPQAVDELTITVNNYAGRVLSFTVFDNDNVLNTFNEIVYNEVKTFTIKEPHMTAIAISGGNNEASIVEICLCLPPENANSSVMQKR
jgi:hypothetical protein